MLLRFIIENFRSFYEPVQFEMFPNMKRTMFMNHIYENKDTKIPLLKQTAIYGANGSGKSNFIKALAFIRAFAIEKDFLKKQSVEKEKFRLIKLENQKPISFIIEFNTAEQTYIYQVDINSDRIEKEELFISGLGEKENELIFSRKDKLFTHREKPGKELETAVNELIRKNPTSSLLSLNKEFPILKNRDLEKAYQWFHHDLEVISIDSVVPLLIEMMAKSPDLLAFTNRIFQSIGTGIEKVKIHRKTPDQQVEEEVKFLQTKDLSSNEIISSFNHRQALFNVSIEDGQKVIKEFLFEQIGKYGFHGELEVSVQSDGTLRILTLIPAIYNAVKKGKTVCIDEIDNSIHPLLMEALIAYFAQAETNGQLIFTTHETCLLNQQKLMRPDEVWFTEKEEGSTRMYSLNDFKEHHTLSIEKGYLEGRYGAIPFIGSLNEPE